MHRQSAFLTADELSNAKTVMSEAQNAFQAAAFPPLEVFGSLPDLDAAEDSDVVALSRILSAASTESLAQLVDTSRQQLLIGLLSSSLLMACFAPAELADHWRTAGVVVQETRKGLMDANGPIARKLLRGVSALYASPRVAFDEVNAIISFLS